MQSKEARFHHFEMLNELGRGGMGVVYRARDLRNGRILALKLILNNSGLVDRERFRRETQILERLDHPNILKTLEFNLDVETPYVATDFVESRTLRQCVEESIAKIGRPPSADWARRVFAKLASALEHAHEVGVVHRDIKPENILIRTSDDEPILIDFGLAKKLGAASFKDAITLSQTGQMIGTPYTMSPEQIDAESFGAVGGATDIWSLGVSLYFCITGERAYGGSTAINTYTSIITGKPPKVSGAPRNIARACAACMTRDQKSRPNATELFQLLQEETEEQGAPRSRSFFLVLAFLLLFAGAAFFFNSGQSGEPASLSLNVQNGPRETNKATYELAGYVNDSEATLEIEGLSEEPKWSYGPGKADGGRSFVVTVPMELGVNEWVLIARKKGLETQRSTLRILRHRRFQVGQKEGADFASLSEAIKEAPEGATLVLEKGLYRQSILVERELTICSEKGARAVIVSANRTPVRSWGAKLHLKDLELRCEVKAPKTGVGLEVLEGSVSAESCHFQSSVGAAVRIIGGRHSFTKCILKRSLGGLHAKSASVNVRDCVIQDIVRDGFSISMTREQVTITGGRVLETLGRGLLLHGGTLTMTGVSFEKNGGHGLHLMECVATLKDCKVQRSKTGLAAEGVRIKVEDCQFLDNSQSGVTLSRKTMGPLTKVFSARNKHSGLTVNGGSEVTVNGCRFEENEGYGIVASATGTRVLVEKTKFALNRLGEERALPPARLERLKDQ